MRLATIGTSWITEAFLQSAKKVGIEYKAAYSRDISRAEAFAEKNGAELCFDSLEEMSLCDEIDAVYIASPNSLHFEQSLLFLQAGKNVLCEKPAVIYPHQLEKLYAEADSRGLIFMEAIMFLYQPELLKLKTAIRSIGTLSSAHLDFSQLSSKYKLLSESFTPNIFNPKLCTGCLMDIGIYNVYTAIELFGEPQKITAVSRFMSTGADSHGTAIFDYPELQVTLNYSKVAQSHADSQILADKGAVLIGSISQLCGIRLCTLDGCVTQLTGELDRLEVMSGEALAFLNFCTQKEAYSEQYRHARETALSVSRALEEIRRQNPQFLF